MIIDRFEGEYAICEQGDQTMVTIKRDRIPKEAKPGDVLLVETGRPIVVDQDETDSRKKNIEKLTGDMWE